MITALDDLFELYLDLSAAWRACPPREKRVWEAMLAADVEENDAFPSGPVRSPMERLVRDLAGVGAVPLSVPLSLLAALLVMPTRQSFYVVQVRCLTPRFAIWELGAVVCHPRYPSSSCDCRSTPP